MCSTSDFFDIPFDNSKCIIVGYTSFKTKQKSSDQFYIQSSNVAFFILDKMFKINEKIAVYFNYRSLFCFQSYKIYYNKKGQFP